MREVAALLGPGRINSATVVGGQECTGAVSLLFQRQLRAVAGQGGVLLDEFTLGHVQVPRKGNHIRGGQQDGAGPAATGTTMLALEKRFRHE